MAAEIVLRTGWRELALRFLDGFNPQPERAIVIADAIVDFAATGDVDESVPLRHHAHDFVRTAHRLIEQQQDPVASSQIDQWVAKWNDKYGV